MSLLSWNCRGIGVPLTVKALRDLCRRYKPAVVFLIETKNKVQKMEKDRRKWFNKYSACYMDPAGQSGGLALWWDSSVKMHIDRMGQNFFHTRIDSDSFEDSVWVTFVYGPNDDRDRWKLWDEVRSFNPGSEMGWLCIGDFNDILGRHEKLGGSDRCLSKIWRFQNFMFDCGFIDMGFQGNIFTWSNNQIGNHHIKVRLDRVVCNHKLQEIFTNAQVTHREPIGSDHSPILVDLLFKDGKTSRGFVFEKRWIDHPDFKKTVGMGWSSAVVDAEDPLLIFCRRLDGCKSILAKWSKSAFPNSKKVFDKLNAELHLLLFEEFTAEAEAAISVVLSKIEEAWDREEKFWEQKARVHWLKSGDKNTRFFHAATLQRRRKNKILKLRVEDDRWVDKEEDIGAEFTKFYSSLFTASTQEGLLDVLDFVQSEITEDDNSRLMAAVTDSEIKLAAFQMGGLKAPGPDGFTGNFYQSSWSIVGADVCRFVRNFFENDVDLQNLNCTNLVFIPKVEGATSVNQFRPISLCNFSYKIISKVIVNRMKGLLLRFISENQRAFVPGRLIQDNIFIAHEAYHHLRTKKKGKNYEMAVKVDMNKAYDRLEWTFIEKVLLKLGFCTEWVSKIMKCVSSVRYNILLSGKKVGDVIPKRGLRQGDPLSPYLFIMASDVLSNMVTAFCDVNGLEGIRLARNCPILSHCFFADDALFFLKANMQNCRVFKNMIDWYCNASGQIVNLDKSCIFFSGNVPPDLKNELCVALGISGVDDPGKYLGLPVVWGRSKCDALNFVKERMVKKIQGWKQNTLTQAGREILIKAVANAVPMYPMACFKFPKRVCDNLNSLLAKFWWGQRQDEGRIHWKAWSKLAVHKSVGGKGFRDFEAFNLALLAKQSWRILTCPNDYWVCILKGLYFPNTDFLTAAKGSKASWAWSSLLEGRDELMKGLCWKIGDGKNVNIWNDGWIPSLPSFKLSARPLDDDCSVLMVSDIIGNGCWVLNDIVQWISPAEKEAILRIPIPRKVTYDSLVWAHSKNGSYTVKSGYVENVNKVTVAQVNASSSNVVPNSLWKEIWRLQVPPKVKHFLWRACSAALPTKVNLFRRKCSPNVMCPCCEKEAETLEHLLFFCDWAKRALFCCMLSVRVDCIGFSSFENWCLKWMVEDNSIDDRCKSFLATMCWEIWKERCQCVFEKHSTNPVLVGIRAANLCDDYWNCHMTREAVSGVSSLTQSVVAASSSAPDAGFLKFNSDGSFFEDRTCAGIGIVVRNHAGEVVDGFGAAVKALSAFSAEALALLKACDMAMALQLRCVVFETDCRDLFLAVSNEDASADWRNDATVSDIVVTLRSSPEYSLKLVSRQANTAADYVAKMAAKEMCPFGWVATPPSPPAKILSRDCGFLVGREASRDGVG